MYDVEYNKNNKDSISKRKRTYRVNNLYKFVENKEYRKKYYSAWLS